MKKGNYYRILVAMILWGLCPMIVFATDLKVDNVMYFSSGDLKLVGSSPDDPWQDDKDAKKGGDKDAKKRPEGEKEIEPQHEPRGVDIETKRPNIKEVPRARPKLRPGAVVDRVKVKRPPVRVKPGRVLHSLGI